MKLVAILACVLAFPAVAGAETTTVDASGASTCSRGTTCKTISAAEGVSQAEDVIVIKKGTYPEAVVVDVPKLTLRADGQVLVSSADGAATLTVSAADVTVDGLAVLRSSASSPAVSITGANVKLLGAAIANFAGPALRLTAGNANVIRRATISGFKDGIQCNVTGMGERRLQVDSSVVLGGTNAAEHAAFRVSTADLSGNAFLTLNHVTTTGTGKTLALEAAGTSGVVVPGGITAKVNASILHGPASAAGFAGTPPVLAGNAVDVTYANSDAPVPSTSGGATTTGAGTVTPDADLFGDKLRLKAGSPAIDKGGALAAGESDQDIDSDPRVVGSASDIGADEYLNKAPALTLVVDVKGQSVTATALANDREGPSDIASYAVDWGDGKTDTGTANVFTHSYEKPGAYTVSMTVTDRGGLTSAAATQAVNLVDADPPQVLVTSPKEGGSVALSGKQKKTFAVKGVFADGSGVTKLEVALTRRTGGCAHFDGTTLVRQGCKTPIFVAAVVKGTRFQLKTPALKFKPGNYQVRVRATDTLGNVTKGFTKALKTLVTFKVT